MGRIKDIYKYDISPKCREEAVVQGEKYRFTVLTHRLIRIEYSENGNFEDRATQTVMNRDFEVPSFTVRKLGEGVEIVTEYMTMTYTGGPFSKNSLSAYFSGKGGSCWGEWHYGDNKGNLKGTARTLDGVNGECALEDGIMSTRRMVTFDDSRSLILSDDGWIDVRNGSDVDIYLFAYKTNYIEALNDWYMLSGKTPMIPRYALGNWWSRYYKYTQDEYKELMLRFKENGVPFSVAVIDMDWHYVDIEPKYGSGWTGFTWNKDLFPDHKEFLDFLHEEGVEPTLNLHPAEGISAHEDCYKDIADYVGVDTSKEKRVVFDVADPRFIEGYFEKILNPMEKEGVSFWWMDWQQGNTTKIPGLDPLWMLNHYHYIDMQKSGKRPMIFSRYAGLGSHRYPVGFSGDTYATWESLDFQPYFTVNATNAGYGWWSHDIGGHMGGKKDDELVTRWVQFGVFSPIMRLHSTSNTFQSKEVWNYNKTSEAVMTDFLRLRHSLIPYLYTMNYRAYNENIPLIQPMYYNCPEENEAYKYRNEYFFGSEMIIAPITQKADEVTMCGSAKAYLPDGLWFDFFNSRMYKGGHSYKMYRNIYTIPALVKAGGIIPMAVPERVNDIENPEKLRIAVFPGADGSFEMYEDDGRTDEYKNGICAKTKMTYKWSPNPVFVIEEPYGSKEIIVKNRSYEIEFRKITDCDNISVTEDGKAVEFVKEYKDGVLCVKVGNVNGTLEVKFNDNVEILQNDAQKGLFDLLADAHYDFNLKEDIYRSFKNSANCSEFLAVITAMDIDRNLYDAVIEIIMASGK